MSISVVDAKRIIDEIHQTRVELKSAIDASEARIQLRIEESYERIRKLEEENTYLKEKIEKLERQQNSTNIVIFGLNKERHEISFEYLRDELQSLLQIDLSINQIKNIHCLGSQKNCPVKVEFVSYLTKKNIFANCKKLKGTGISIAHDLTAQQRADLVVLKRHLQTHRLDKNKKSFIKGNKLIVDEIEYAVEQLLEIEQGEEFPDEVTKTNSTPATPTQPLIREVFEEEKSHQAAKPNITTPKISGSSGTVRKQPQKSNVNKNIEKVKTRSTSEKK